MYKDNKWKISKITILKHYEQLLFKTFYFTTQNFVELLNVMGRLLEYFQNFIKCVSASIKSLKAIGLKGKQKKEEKDKQGVFCKMVVSFL